MKRKKKRERYGWDSGSGRPLKALGLQDTYHPKARSSKLAMKDRPADAFSC